MEVVTLAIAKYKKGGGQDQGRKYGCCLPIIFLLQCALFG